MKRAALGVRMHSGWGVVVGVCAEGGSVEVIERRRIVVVDPKIPGGKQPYHHAAGFQLAEAEKYLAECARASERLALVAVRDMVRELDARGYGIVGCAVLVGAGRRLPELGKILGSHPLIHTAEGEFFRDAVRKACDGLGISATGIPEREIGERARTALGKAAGGVERIISSMGKAIGPPWTKDHKTAALAALMVLEHQPCSGVPNF